MSKRTRRPSEAESTGTVDSVDIDQDREDLKGLTGIDRYPVGKESPERSRRSHGATRRDRGVRGHFIAADTTHRFWTNVHVQSGGCWIWTGGLTKDGYGRFHVTVAPGVHRRVKAHRWAWVHLVGPIRPGYTLDHLIAPDGPCTSKACVRVFDHLEEVTRAENARRAAMRRSAHQQGGETP
jgi:hypothetical protein